MRRHETVAFRTAYLITRSAADAEDAAQDGFVKTYRALGRFRGGAPFRPWLLRIVANEARNRRRTAGRRAALAERAALLTTPGAERSPEEAALGAERCAALLAALERLSEEDRLVIGMRWFLELDEAEMAAALDRPRGTVKSRLSRAMGRLRALLTAEAAVDDAAGERAP